MVGLVPLPRWALQGPGINGRTVGGRTSLEGSRPARLPGAQGAPLRCSAASPPIPRAWGGPSAPAPAAPGPACTPRAPGVPLCIPAASPSRPTAAGRFLGARHGRPGTDVASRDAWRAAESSHYSPGPRHASGKGGRGGRGRHPIFIRLRAGGAFPIQTRATTARQGPSWPSRAHPISTPAAPQECGSTHPPGAPLSPRRDKAGEQGAGAEEIRALGGQPSAPTPPGQPTINQDRAPSATYRSDPPPSWP